VTTLHLLDILVIIGFFTVIAAITLYYTRRAGKDTDQFFLSGRNMPWYIAGTAMVATTFAADTPLAVTELVARNGIAGNWLWWNLAIGGMLTVFFFARLWRRAGIMTDVEFTEIRYSGKEAAVLRGFRALYLGFFMNAIVMGWVNKAMEKVFSITFPELDAFYLVVAGAFIIALYSTASGLLGSARTDSFQFVFAMAGSIIFAVLILQVKDTGGMMNIKAQLPAHLIEFFPTISKTEGSGLVSGTLALSAGAFIAHIGLQWWSSWYPGADPGGGGYVAQRMMSAKDETHSFLATLWFTIAHYALRPWPWIIVGLAALVILPRANSVQELQLESPVLYQQVEEIYQNRTMLKSEEVQSNPELLAFYEKYENTIDPGIMYPKLMLRFLPPGIFGLLIAVFLAAYMSTISSQLNWGTSYLINDFYRRFIRKDGDEKHYVLISRLGIVFMTISSLLITRYALTTISGAWEFIINASAGMGLVLILRWFWWRINAWSEIAAMLAPLVIYPIARFGYGMESPFTLYPIVLGTTLVWLLVTFVTKPVDESRLIEFYRRTHPGGIGWKHIAPKVPGVVGDSGFARQFVNWLLGVIVVYTFLFGIGDLLFAEYGTAAIYLTAGLISALVIYRNLVHQYAPDDKG
jgi:SSS family solute:Na+ symporter